MFIVSPPGIHISLGICVWGYTYHGDTHITVTPESYCGGLGTSPFSIVTEALLYKKHVSLPVPSQKNSKL